LELEDLEEVEPALEGEEVEVEVALVNPYTLTY